MENSGAACFGAVAHYSFLGCIHPFSGSVGSGPSCSVDYYPNSEAQIASTVVTVDPGMGTAAAVAERTVEVKWGLGIGYCLQVGAVGLEAGTVAEVGLRDSAAGHSLADAGRRDIAVGLPLAGLGLGNIVAVLLFPGAGLQPVVADHPLADVGLCGVVAAVGFPLAVASLRVVVVLFGLAGVGLWAAAAPTRPQAQKVVASELWSESLIVRVEPVGLA